MTRVLVIGVGERLPALAERLRAGGYEPVPADGSTDPLAGGTFDAVIVGASHGEQGACWAVDHSGCVFGGVPMVTEVGSACESSCGDRANPAVNRYAIDDLLSGALLRLLGTAIAQHREAVRLRDEVEDRASAIGLIMGGLFQVRTLTEARNLSTMLSLACPDPARVVVGLRELIANAIEHGNLAITCEEKGDLLREGRWEAEIARRLASPEYRDRRATVQFRREDHRAIFQVRDEGSGFDWQRYLRFDPARLLAPNGRGIAMAKAMSFDTLTYVGAGNDVIATANFASADSRTDKAA